MSTGTPCLSAMNPSTEKTTNPATKLVPLLSRHNRKVSLKVTGKTVQNHLDKYTNYYMFNYCIQNIYFDN
jgi:hypothetical protein